MFVTCVNFIFCHKQRPIPIKELNNQPLYSQHIDAEDIYFAITQLSDDGLLNVQYADNKPDDFQLLIIPWIMLDDAAIGKMQDLQRLRTEFQTNQLFVSLGKVIAMVPCHTEP